MRNIIHDGDGGDKVVVKVNDTDSRVSAPGDFVDPLKGIAQGKTQEIADGAAMGDSRDALSLIFPGNRKNRVPHSAKYVFHAVPSRG